MRTELRKEVALNGGRKARVTQYSVLSTHH
jgi:hypothetical protein